jgi:hypothetical protein
MLLVVERKRENFVTPKRSLLPSKKDYEKLVWLRRRRRSLPIALNLVPF